MTARAALLLCMLMQLLSQATAASAAQRAFMPPEVTAQERFGVGLQLEAVGELAAFDSDEYRRRQRERCEKVLHQPYVNEVPLGLDGRHRETIVVLPGRSYLWSETERVGPQAGIPCRYELRHERRLVVAHFDGKRTHTVQYDYLRRTVARSVVLGDTTALAVKDHVSTSSGRQRNIAGLTCTDRELARGPGDPSFAVTACVTGPRPVEGREQPLVLARHVGRQDQPMIRWEARAVRPAVEVDLGAFEGPRGFREQRKAAAQAPQEGDE